MTEALQKEQKRGGACPKNEGKPQRRMPLKRNLQVSLRGTETVQREVSQRK